ncbi:restriction endonuclease subunit S [Endozoicomonas acroporae]|uniref:restriction endonuclease subunit S n=1 Tax=Endozoicomonas acroporae TaxID=1701104 RepID=UPI0019D6A142|nr:restriction endonuclease subunit S [Endozoicomonas acroporae]
MSEWVDIELGDFIELKRGYDLPKKNRVDGQVSIISSSGESGFHNAAKVKGPGVVTGRYGTIGEVYYTEKDFWPLNTTLYVKDFKGNDPLFVYYFLKTIPFSDYSDKAAVPGINRNHLHKARIRVPADPDYQKELAKKLWSLDSKIRLNQQTNQNLEAIAQTLFKSWFVDFDPVKAKLSVLAAGGSAEEAERAAMCAISARDEASLNTLQTEQPEAYAELAGTAALFPSAMQDSELGEIPEGWEVSPLGSLIDIKHGFAFKGEYFSTEPTKNILLTPGNFRIGGGFKADKLKYYNGPIPENYLLSHNDLLVTMTDLSKAGDTLGYPALIPNSKYLCYLHNQRLGKVVFKNKLIGKEFIYQCLTTKVYRNEVLATATGSTVKHTSPKKILAYQVIHSKSGVERVFEQHCQKLTQTVSMNELNSLTLAKLRDTLLPKLLSGELTVTNTPPKANPPESDMLNAGSVPAEVIV